MINNLRSIRVRADEVVIGDDVAIGGVVGIVTEVAIGHLVYITIEAGMAGTVTDTFTPSAPLWVGRNVYGA